MAAEELVERVVAGDVHGEAGLAAPGAAPHLPQARDRARERDADRRVELADVDAELERARGAHGHQLALGQPPLDLAPLLRRVAGAVGGDQLAEVGPARVLELEPRELLEQLDAAPRLHEADRPHAVLDQPREHGGGLAQRRDARAGLLVEERRVPHRHLALGARRAVAVDEAELDARELLGELERVGDRGAREDEARLGAVGAREAPQPSAGRSPRASRTRRGTRAPRRRRSTRGSPARRPTGGGGASRRRSACPGS